MYRLKNNINFTSYLIKILRNRHPQLLLTLFFINYVYLKLIRLFEMRMEINVLPDEEFQNQILRYCRAIKHFVDSNSCALSNLEQNEFATWCYLCSSSSRKKYKILIINLENIPKGKLYISDTMRFNLQNSLDLRDFELHSYFVFSAISTSEMYATEAIVSLISNPYECPTDFMDSLLQNYFSKPRYLRCQDVFSIKVKEYSPDCFYSAINPELTEVYFVVKSIKMRNLEEKGNGFYVVHGITTLIQESNVQSYLPTLHPFEESQNLITSSSLIENLIPSCLEYPLQQLEPCIIPFLQQGSRINIRPVFLVEGPQGSGKFKLIQIAAKRMGLNLLNVDFSEIQTLSSTQTEAKLRIAIKNAENSVPCILSFRNIQLFGINVEGERDDRIISAFETELKKLYEKNLRYPVVVIATSESSDLPADLERLFVETINLKYSDQNQRTNILACLLKNKGISYKADLHKIAGLCSDFVLADFEALILNATKMKYKTMDKTQTNESSVILLDDDFTKACDYMQSMLSDRIGSPHVPKVHWEDIGGLADLKHEIIRRIELPLLNDIGIGQSGLLLYGPPGTGKTLLAKAVATECQLHFLSVKGPELLNMYVGQSEKNVRQVFERARAAAPCIIFFDELDSLAPNRGQSGDSGGVMDRVVSQLLSEMDGLESSNNIFIIGATNRPDLIDPALLRPGRFDKMLYVGIYSDKDSQISVLKALTRHFKMEKEGRELKELVEGLPTNLTGADLYSVCSNAWLLAVRKNLMEALDTGDEKVIKDSTKLSTEKEVIIKLEHFVSAARQLIPSVSKEELMKYEKLRDEAVR